MVAAVGVALVRASTTLSEMGMADAPPTAGAEPVSCSCSGGALRHAWALQQRGTEIMDGLSAAEVTALMQALDFLRCDDLAAAVISSVLEQALAEAGTVGSPAILRSRFGIDEHAALAQMALVYANEAARQRARLQRIEDRKSKQRSSRETLQEHLAALTTEWTALEEGVGRALEQVDGILGDGGDMQARTKPPDLPMDYAARTSNHQNILRPTSTMICAADSPHTHKRTFLLECGALYGMQPTTAAVPVVFQWPFVRDRRPGRER